MKKKCFLAFVLFAMLTGVAQSYPTVTDSTVVLKDSLHVRGNARVNGFLITKHIKGPHGIVHIGDSSMVFSTSTGTNPISGLSATSEQMNTSGGGGIGISPSSSSAAIAYGTNAVAIGYNARAYGNNSLALSTAANAESDAQYGIAMGYAVKASSTATKSIAMGSGINTTSYMTNTIANSLALGFNSDIPTFFVSGGAGTTGSLGNVGVGTTSPLARLSINGDAVFTSGTSTPSSAAYIKGNNAVSTATTPDYTWYGDLTTGIFHQAANTIAFTSGGTEKMRIKANGDICINVPNTSPGNQIYFKGTSDSNHGIGFYNNYTNTAATYINGPVLYGYDGGALATKDGGDKIALQWDNTGAVMIPAIKSATSGVYNTILVDVNGKLVPGSSVSSTTGVNWVLGGNASAGAALGTTDANSDLPFITANTEKMRIKANGDIRINIQGAYHTKGSQLFFNGTDTYHGLGYYYTYTNAASKAFTIDGPVLYGYGGGALVTSNGNIMALQWDASGKVHIGAQSVTSGLHTDALLTVSGKVACQEVRVFTNSAGTYWADYVFNNDYKLLPLHKVEEYYLKNKHLPNVPSAAEISEQGNDLAKTDAILLSKIEENTIYIVDLNKKLEKLAKENEELKTLVKKLISK